jgi:hypothetical protein
MSLQTPLSWTVAQVVSTVSTLNSFRPAIAVDPFDNVHIVWQDQTGYKSSGGDSDIFYRRWNATTSSWSTTLVISNQSTSHSHAPFLATDDSGNVHIVWFDYTDYSGAGNDADIVYRLWNHTTTTWGPVEVVSTSSNDESLWPRIATQNQTAFVVWQDPTPILSSGSDNDIFFKQRNPNGTWTATELVSSESADLSRFPSLTIDTKGNVHVVWDDATNYGSSGGDEDVFYKYKNRTTQLWSTTEVVSTESTGHSERAKIIVDPLGDRHVVWSDVTGILGAGIDRDIFYKLWDHSSKSWGSTQVVSTESTSRSEVPSLERDVLGNLYCLWFDTTNLNNNGSDYDVFFKIWNSTTQGWGAVEVVSIDSTDDSWRPEVALDSTQRLHVVWIDRTPNYLGSGNDIDIFYAVGAVSLVSPVLALLIHPIGTNYEVNTTGNTLVWLPSDANTSNPTYALYRDGQELLNQSWASNTPIIYNLDGLPLGDYNFTLVLVDGWGETLEDVVLVSMINVPPIIINLTPIVQYTHATIGHNLTWIITDLSITNTTYTISQGDTVLTSGSWTPNTPVHFSVDGLDVGNHNYTLSVTDGLGGTTLDTVSVIVTPPANPFLEVGVNTLLGGLLGFGLAGLTLWRIRRGTKYPQYE